MEFPGSFITTEQQKPCMVCMLVHEYSRHDRMNIPSISNRTLQSRHADDISSIEVCHFVNMYD